MHTFKKPSKCIKIRTLVICIKSYSVGKQYGLLLTCRHCKSLFVQTYLSFFYKILNSAFSERLNYWRITYRKILLNSYCTLKIYIFQFNQLIERLKEFNFKFVLLPKLFLVLYSVLLIILCIITVLVINFLLSNIFKSWTFICFFF